MSNTVEAPRINCFSEAEELECMVNSITAETYKYLFTKVPEKRRVSTIVLKCYIPLYQSNNVKQLYPEEVNYGIDVSYNCKSNLTVKVKGYNGRITSKEYTINTTTGYDEKVDLTECKVPISLTYDHSNLNVMIPIFTEEQDISIKILRERQLTVLSGVFKSLRVKCRLQDGSYYNHILPRECYFKNLTNFNCSLLESIIFKSAPKDDELARLKKYSDRIVRLDYRSIDLEAIESIVFSKVTHLKVQNIKSARSITTKQFPALESLSVVRCRELITSQLPSTVTKLSVKYYKKLVVNSQLEHLKTLNRIERYKWEEAAVNSGVDLRIYPTSSLTVKVICVSKEERNLTLKMELSSLNKSANSAMCSDKATVTV